MARPATDVNECGDYCTYMPVSVTMESRGEARGGPLAPMRRSRYAVKVRQKSSSCIRGRRMGQERQRSNLCRRRNGPDGRRRATTGGSRGAREATATATSAEACRAKGSARDEEKGGRSGRRRPGLARVWACSVVAHPSRWRWVLAAKRAGRGCNGNGGVGVWGARRVAVGEAFADALEGGPLGSVGTRTSSMAEMG